MASAAAPYRLALDHRRSLSTSGARPSISSTPTQCKAVTSCARRTPYRRRSNYLHASPALPNPAAVS